MSDRPVNLNLARKARERIAARKTADENAVKHSRTKAERIAEAARSAKLRAHLDGRRFTDEE